MRQCCTCSQQPAVVLRQQGVPGRGGAVGSLGILQRGKLIFPLHLERNKVSSKTQNNNAVVIIHRLPLQCCFKEQCSGRIREQWCCSCRTLFHPAMKAQNIQFYFTWKKKTLKKSTFILKHLEKGNTSKTNFSILMPLGLLGLTWWPLESTKGTFFIATCCCSWSLYFLWAESPHQRSMLNPKNCSILRCPTATTQSAFV